jgi:signal transduction histidine kinase
MVARHRVLTVILGTVALFGCALPSGLQQRVPLSATEVTIAVVTFVAFAVILIVRWPPWLLVAVTVAGAVGSMAAGTADALLNGVLLVALLVFLLRSERTPAIVAMVATAGALGAAYLLFGLHTKTGPANLIAVPCLVVVFAVEEAVRARRAQKAMLEERARHAEESREQRERQRIQERIHAERLRIARELHDAVGHHVALISVQAGAMGYLLEADPARARESLTHIQHASEAALEELRLTVGLLRQPGESEPTEPAGKLSGLDELIGSFAATGLKVTCEVTGQAQPVPEAVDLTAYRMIQESLTNTAKHAAGASASVRLAYRPGVLALTVEDDGPGQSGNDQVGHGIIGMRERAAALGGWASAGPRNGGGGFQVQAELPLQAGAAS